VQQSLFLDLHVPNLKVKELDYEKHKIYAENLHRYELLVNCSRESHTTSKQQVDGNLMASELPTSCGVIVTQA
jgi:hypothetical protein